MRRATSRRRRAPSGIHTRPWGPPETPWAYSAQANATGIPVLAPRWVVIARRMICSRRSVAHQINGTTPSGNPSGKAVGGQRSGMLAIRLRS